MNRWGYEIRCGSIRSREVGVFPTEKTAREAAVEECRSYKAEAGPFFIEVVVYPENGRPLKMGEERYTAEEIREYGKGKYLSFGELMSLAKENYSKGGDTVYECWDQRTFDDYVQMFGPVSRKTVRHIICQKY